MTFKESGSAIYLLVLQLKMLTKRRCPENVNLWLAQSQDTVSLKALICTYCCAQGAEKAGEEPARNLSSFRADFPTPREHARHAQVRLRSHKAPKGTLHRIFWNFFCWSMYLCFGFIMVQTCTEFRANVKNVCSSLKDILTEFRFLTIFHGVIQICTPPRCVWYTGGVFGMLFYVTPRCRLHRRVKKTPGWRLHREVSRK